MTNPNGGTTRMPGYPSEALRAAFEPVLHRLPSDRASRAERSVQSMCEAMDRVVFRLDELRIRETELVAKGMGTGGLPHRLRAQTGHETQLRLLNALEALHQHVYAAISSVMKVVQRCAPIGVASGMPLNSVSKWLGWLDEREGLDRDSVALDLIRRSVEVRTRVIDHPQQHAFDNWMTVAVHARANVVFFRTATAPIPFAHAGLPTDPFSPDIGLPVAVSAQIVPPNPEEVTHATVALSVGVAAWLGRQYG